MQSTWYLFILLALVSAPAFGQRQLDVGVRLQKSIGLYTENGLTAQYTPNGRVSQRLYFGLSYVTSRLGTALGSNAIRQDNFLLNASYFFRPRWVVRSVARLNVGYFAADYGEAIFDALPRTSPLVSPELGLCYCPKFPLKIGAGIGYNLITGDGLSGPGTLYPAFVQTSVTWNFLSPKK